MLVTMDMPRLFAPTLPAVLVALAITLTTLAPTPARAIEEPDFTLVSQSDAFELRQYTPYMVAEVTLPGPREQADRDAFRLLFGYISGRNGGERKIEMTAPVTSERKPARIEMTAPVTSGAGEAGFVTGFVLPRQFTSDNVPLPTDPRVVLREVPAQTVAVRRFSGRWSDERVAGEVAALRDAVARAGLKVAAEPVLSRFDPPFMPPFLRRNEIWLRVAE